MRKIISIAFFIILSNSTYSQGTYDYEMIVNIKVRTDAAEILENKNVKTIFHFTSNLKSLQSCKGFQYVSFTNEDLKLVTAFSTFININNWKFETELSNNTKDIYSNTCSFAYYPENGNNMIKATREIALIKYKNGTQTFLIIGFDGVNTLVITFN